MKKIVLLLIIMLGGIGHSTAQCAVSTFIEDNYTQYAKFLALREIQSNPADPDYDNPIVPVDRITPFLEKLSAIYENPNNDPIIDQLFGDFSINVNPEYMFRTPYKYMALSVESTAPWLDDFINTGVSGNATLDNLVATYDFYLDNDYVVGANTILELETNMDALNMNALEDEFLAVANVSSTFADVIIQDRFNYDGISYSINSEPVTTCDISTENNSFTFCLFAGDCFAGCLYSECWVVEVSEDCSIITVLDAPSTTKVNFKVYPNPASDFIHIQGVTSEINETLIYSVAGQLMQSAASNSEKINISYLQSGIYFLEISTSEGNTQIQKFIKH